MTGDSRTVEPLRWPRFRAVAEPTLWRYQSRLFPVVTFLAFAGVCCAWAVTSRLDAPIESTVLAIIASIGLSIVLVDPAAPVTAASVVDLRWRRIPPWLIGLGLASAMWLLGRILASGVRAAPAPDGWAILEWSTIAASQLAVGAVRSRRRPESTSFGPGILVGLLWYIAVSAPRLHQLLFDPSAHLWRWLSLLAVFVIIACAGSIDPAHRFRKQSLG